jgi:N-acetylneuraminic acid mutarotase
LTHFLVVLLVNVVSTCEWQRIPSPEIRTHAHGVVYDPVNDLFFITGGDSTDFEDSDFTDMCLEFDPKTNTWNTKQPMPTKRGRHRAAYRNGFMHVFCGKDQYGNHINIHEVYDIKEDCWATKKAAPLPVARPSAVTWKDSLVYLIGGYDVNHTARTEVYFYNVTTNSWNAATALPRGLHCGTAEIKGDSIFIFGGADGSTYYSRILLGEINPTDPKEINWCWEDSFPMAYNGTVGLAIKDNNAYMIGGDFDDGTNEVWQYDIQNESWTSLPDYPTNNIHRGDFAQRRDCPDSLGILYCFMGDTAIHSRHSPTDECYKLVETIIENDAGICVINSPISDKTIKSFIRVSGTVKNYGANTYSFKTYVNIYDPDHFIVFSNSIQVDDLASSDTLNIDFGSFRLMEVGTHTVEMFTHALNDENTSNDSLTATFNSYDCHWQKLPSPGISNHDHATVYDFVNDLFFIIGGDSTGSETNMDICLVFDPKTNTWETKQPMPTKRGRHRAAYRYSLSLDSSDKYMCKEDNGFIHVLCGKDENATHTNKHEVYDIRNDCWFTKAPAPLALSRPGVVTWKNFFVYLIGGYDITHTARKEVHYYNPETDSWQPSTPLPRGLHAGGVDIKGDSIFIIGGADGYRSFSNILIGEINPLDPSSINWYWGDSLPIPDTRENGLAIKNNKAYMIGGLFNNGNNQVWEYDILNQRWTSLPDYPTNIIMRGDFAENRGSADSSAIVIYSFMGDTAISPRRNPTDECYLLVRPDSLPNQKTEKEEEKTLEENSASLNSIICSTNEISIGFNSTETTDLIIYMYDLSGREILSQSAKDVSTVQYEIALDEKIKNGIYLIRVEYGSNVALKKVVLIR